MKGIFFIAGEAGTQKNDLIKNAKSFLEEKSLHVAVFTPVGDSAEALYSVQDAKHMIVEGKKDVLLEQVIKAYKKIESENDFVIVNGTDLNSRDTVVEFRLNKLMAKHLCLPVSLIMCDDTAVLESADFITRILKQDHIDVIGLLTGIKGLDYILNEALAKTTSKLSTKMFEANLSIQASSDKQRIVLPEGECDRVLKAAAEVARQKTADLVILGNPQKITERATELNISLADIRLIDYENADNFEDYAQTLCELRKAKGMTIEEARDLMKDGAYYGTMMVYKGDADGMVSGAEHTTANTIRPALQFVKTKAGVSVVSGAFLMCLNGALYVFADCAVTPNPTPEQLSEIAITTAATARQFGLDPRVAFLSYGTGDSGKGPSVDAVKEAVRLTKEKNVDFKLEGPIQFDAAIDPVVAKTKLPNSEVAGHANVFVFPDLNTGNCCYKAVQRALGDECLAVGPVLQGLNKPVNDLSRGATVQDIINTIAFTAVQAQTK